MQFYLSFTSVFAGMKIPRDNVQSNCLIQFWTEKQKWCFLILATHLIPNGGIVVKLDLRLIFPPTPIVHFVIRFILSFFVYLRFKTFNKFWKRCCTFNFILISGIQSIAIEIEMCLRIATPLFYMISLFSQLISLSRNLQPPNPPVEINKIKSHKFNLIDEYWYHQFLET